MVRHTIDRWADTAGFRVSLILAGLIVVPVLLVGLAITVGGVAKVFGYEWPGEIEPEAIAVLLLSTGGGCGFVGYFRAHHGVKGPRGHNITATLVLLTAGVVAAVSVAVVVVVTLLGAGLPYREALGVLLLGALFAAANSLWAFAGIAWMQRLLHRYNETTGSAYDGLPVVLLIVALVLAITAALRALTL